MAVSPKAGTEQREDQHLHVVAEHRLLVVKGGEDARGRLQGGWEDRQSLTGQSISVERGERGEARWVRRGSQAGLWEALSKSQAALTPLEEWL